MGQSLAIDGNDRRAKCLNLVASNVGEGRRGHVWKVVSLSPDVHNNTVRRV